MEEYEAYVNKSMKLNDLNIYRPYNLISKLHGNFIIYIAGLCYKLGWEPRLGHGYNADS